MLNMCGLSSKTPEFAAKIDVYMLTLCSAMEDLARNEKEAVQVLYAHPGFVACTSEEAPETFVLCGSTPRVLVKRRFQHAV